MCGDAESGTASHYLFPWTLISARDADLWRDTDKRELVFYNVTNPHGKAWALSAWESVSTQPVLVMK